MEDCIPRRIQRTSLSEDVVDLAWERGYVVIYHGGCTTGICQVNDTDLHAAFEREYQVCEEVSFFEQNLVDPGSIGRTRQQVVDDAVSVSTMCKESWDTNGQACRSTSQVLRTT